MLKILFNDNRNFKIKRNEMISFINLVAKVGRAIEGLHEMNEIIKRDKYYFILIKGIVIFLLSIILLLINYIYVTFGFRKDTINRKVNHYIINEIPEQKLVEYKEEAEDKSTNTKHQKN